nr:hypothetical protein [Streptomyces sp. ODS25]
MPACIPGEAGNLPEAVKRHPKTPSRTLPTARLLLGHPGLRPPGPAVKTHLTCPSCGSSHVAQMLGDNGGVSYVCTACGHNWS